MSDRPSSLVDDRPERVRQALAGRLSSVVVVCEAVNRRHNISAILRSAECFGLHEAHLVTGSAPARDGVDASAFRPSRGAARGAERWLELHLHAEVGPCLQALKDRGFRVYVADLAPDALAPAELPVDGPLVLVFGSEILGISDQARALADGTVTVPMHGLTESLNVSVAAGCVLQAVTERRRAALRARGLPGDLPLERQQAFFDAWQAAELEAALGREARLGE